MAIDPHTPITTLLNIQLAKVALSCRPEKKKESQIFDDPKR